jgi:hypothetical protein
MESPFIKTIIPRRNPELRRQREIISLGDQTRDERSIDRLCRSIISYVTGLSRTPTPSCQPQKIRTATDYLFVRPLKFIVGGLKAMHRTLTTTNKLLIMHDDIAISLKRIYLLDR